jgi:branched-chain amino acid transport system substrate-binding protein
VDSLGPDAEGLIIIGSRVFLEERYLQPQSDPADAVIKGYRDFWLRLRPGTVPSHFGGHARDALTALIQVLRNSPNRSREAIRDGLEQLGRFNGVTGTFTFTPSDHAGLTPEAFSSYKIQNTIFLPLSDVK